MFILINFSEDGDSYTIFTNLEIAKKAFAKAWQEVTPSTNSISLVKVEEGVEFGFNSWGDLYGAEEIETFENREE